MTIALWIVAGLLAVAFAAAGFMKLTSTPEQLAEKGMGWAQDFSPNTVKAIGGLEVLAAIGLIVPPLVGVAPVLAPLAAVGLVLMMIGALIVHARRGEKQAFPANAILGLLAAFVAWGGFTAAF
ncbi:DoxX family protein [Knoellia sinensis KCTC 19936]|uniref:DoxX family protein n=1 Tax=Knoellia sinensis KCTC 19936 TaxID=1385520 RepID=A0A0A0JAV4_9MICO|nr:DoxX family protein [Knoellia sinensis]KGN34283.1 DoxX family protein [Knoellia sinensis KCTC 19936]